MKFSRMTLMGAAVLAGAGTYATVSEGGSRLAPRVADGEATFEVNAPSLFIEGDPYLVRLTVSADKEKPTTLESGALTPESWLVDGKPLTRRSGDAQIELQPGQVLETVLDLAPLIEDRMGEDLRDFRAAFARGGEPKEVIFLGQAESGIDFMKLPEEQLANYQVILETTDGPIWLEMWPDVAPNHVRNYLDLCASGFYDGSPFHRVIPSFMVQGGRAKDGTPAPRKVNAEFNDRPHEAGVLSAARLGNDVNSASSEFFVVHQTSRHLDGSYSAFGKVISGMDAVDAVVDGVSVNYEMVEGLMRNRLPIRPNDQRVAMVRDAPNPAKEIRRALVVKATRSRPTNDR